MLKTNSMLQREQVELCSMERKLLSVLPKIQEALNSLKVEELHLKSQALQQALSSQPTATSSRSNVNKETSSQSMVTNHERINQQQINLDVKCTMDPYDDSETDSD